MRVLLRASPAVCALLAAISLLACSPRGQPDAAKARARSLEMWDRIGLELARESAAVGPVDKVVIVRMEDHSRDFEGALRIEASYRKELASHLSPAPAVDLLGVSDLPLPPSAPASLAPPRRELEPAILEEAIRRAGPKGLVVSLLGEPMVIPTKSASMPAFICFAPNGHAPLAQAIREGFVRAAVAPRHTDPPKDEKSWYELRYTVLRPDNIGAW